MQAACQRLSLSAPRHETVQLFSGEATGLTVRLPKWHYPVVCDLASGRLHFDNFGGRWGDQQHLDRFLQAYAVEKARSEDHESDVYLVATSNDITKLPPEFSRAERFDGVVFLDLPGREEKDAIWQLYLNEYQLDARQRRPADENWTGAEIRACCRLAALLDLPLVQAAQNVVPVAVTAAESVERLRTWASGRCLSADKPGIYRRSTAPATTKLARKISRDPSAN